MRASSSKRVGGVLLSHAETATHFAGEPTRLSDGIRSRTSLGLRSHLALPLDARGFTRVQRDAISNGGARKLHVPRGLIDLLLLGSRLIKNRLKLEIEGKTLAPGIT